MKKIILGMVAAFALVSFLAPIARAEDAFPAADAKPVKEKKAKKSKKVDKALEGGEGDKK